MTPQINPTRADIATIEANLTNLIESFKNYTMKNDASMDAIKKLLEKLSERLGTVMTSQTDNAVRVSNLEIWRTGVDAQLVGSKDDRQQLWRKVDRLESQLSLVRWAGGLLGGGVITWLLANLLGLIK